LISAGVGIVADRSRLTLWNSLLLGREYRVKLDPAFASFIIAISTLEGVGRSLDPNLNIFRSAVPVIARFHFKNLLIKRTTVGAAVSAGSSCEWAICRKPIRKRLE
jgi:predicted unusual protein kinase regulating ubiquinone biosynthesis (AarF/ABC1/UbiB family)